MSDAKPDDEVSFKSEKREAVALFLASEAIMYKDSISQVKEFIEGFESPLGMEALASVDWLYFKENVPLNVEAMRGGIHNWKHGASSAMRKSRIFSDQLILDAISRIKSSALVT